MNIYKIRFIIGIVKDVTKDGFYTIGTKEGTIAGQYSRNQIAPCASNKFIELNDVPDTILSLKAASSKVSTVGGQGFSRCNCTTKCVSKRCKYKKIIYSAIRNATVHCHVAINKCIINSYSKLKTII